MAVGSRVRPIRAARGSGGSRERTCGATASDAPSRGATRLLFFGVARFALMPDSQDQYDVFDWQPAVLCNVTVLAARQYEFPSAIFGHTTQQRVVRENLECLSCARQLRQRPLGIGLGDKIEQALKVVQRPGGYLDARHERARGRRGFLPPILAAR